MSTSSSMNIGLMIVFGSLQAASAYIPRYPSDPEAVTTKTSYCHRNLQTMILTKINNHCIFLASIGFCSLILFISLGSFLIRRTRKKSLRESIKREVVYSTLPEKEAGYGTTEDEKNSPAHRNGRDEKREEETINLFGGEEINPAYYRDESVDLPLGAATSDVPSLPPPPPPYVPVRVPWFPEFNITDLPPPTLEFDTPLPDSDFAEPLIAVVDQDQSESARDKKEESEKEKQTPRRARTWNSSEPPTRTIVDQGINIATGQRWKRRVTVYAGGEGILGAGAGFGGRC